MPAHLPSLPQRNRCSQTGCLAVSRSSGGPANGTLGFRCSYRCVVPAGTVIGNRRRSRRSCYMVESERLSIPPLDSLECSPLAEQVRQVHKCLSSVHTISVLSPAQSTCCGRFRTTATTAAVLAIARSSLWAFYGDGPPHALAFNVAASTATYGRCRPDVFIQMVFAVLHLITPTPTSSMPPVTAVVTNNVPAGRPPQK